MRATTPDPAPTSESSDRASLQISVIGAANADDALARSAEAVGRRLAERGAVVVSGGRGGVMAAASRGSREAGGRAVGILPGADAEASPPNPDVDTVVFTGLGQARNLCVVLSGAAVIAIGGGWGTLSEIALARKHGIPVVTLDSWSLDVPDGEEPLVRADSPEAAVDLALDLAGRRSGARRGA